MKTNSQKIIWVVSFLAWKQPKSMTGKVAVGFHLLLWVCALGLDAACLGFINDKNGGFPLLLASFITVLISLFVLLYFWLMYFNAKGNEGEMHLEGDPHVDNSDEADNDLPSFAQSAIMAGPRMSVVFNALSYLTVSVDADKTANDQKTYQLLLIAVVTIKFVLGNLIERNIDKKRAYTARMMKA